MKRWLIINVIVLLLVSCHLHKSKNDTKEEIVPLAKIDDFNNYRENDNYSIVNAFIDGDILNLDVTYSGGCKEHSFELIGSGQLLKSYPPQRNVLLVHQANGDDCRELMGERIMFNVKNLASENKEVMLIIKGYKNGVLY